MHTPSISRKFKFKTLYNWKNNPSGTEINFKTDRYGTIFPSTLEKVNKDNSRSFLFCGGSTIETSYVREGFRIPDIFGSILDVKTINASKSGKDLKGCIETIEYVLLNSNSIPEYIFIGTNLNTLGYFAIEKSINTHKDNYLNVNSIPDIFPGIYKSLSIIKRSNSFFSEVLSPRYRLLDKKFQTYEVADKEYLLGCCSIASQMNKNKNKVFNWESIENKNSYRNHISQMINELEIVMEKFKVNKNNVFIFIEPNSYHLEKIASKYDYRKNQILTDKNGENYSFIQTSLIYKNYDEIYKKEFLKRGFKIIKKPLINNGDIFYDSIHFTEFGSNFIGKYISKEFKKFK